MTAWLWAIIGAFAVGTGARSLALDRLILIENPHPGGIGGETCLAGTGTGRKILLTLLINQINVVNRGLQSK